MFEIFLIKKRLRECREKKGFTRPKICKLAKVSWTALTDWEIGPRLPRLDIAGQLAELYGVSVDYILGRTDNPEVNK